MNQVASYIQLTPDPIPIEWRTDVDRFLHLVREEVSGQVDDVTGHSQAVHPRTDEEPFEYFGMTITSAKLTSQLCALPLTTGSLIALARFPNDPLQTEIEIWTLAVLRAVPRISEAQTLHDWWAVIGATTDHNSDQAINAVSTIGDDLTLTPTGNPYVEVVESFVPSLNGGQLFASFPAVAHGASYGYSFPVAQEVAAEYLGRLCAVLSIAWDGCWQIRQAPSEHLIEPSHLPRSRLVDPNAVNDFPHESKPVEVPLWVADALTLVDIDDNLLTAVRAHHQGMMLEARSPSYALLAYVAAIEGIGSRYVDLERCACCSSCNVMVGSGRRFRTALRMVLPKDEVAVLSKRLYETRSSTAHQGQLHGGETLFGSFPGARLFTQNDSRFFRYQHVWPLRRASRELLSRALQGELPPLTVSVPAT